MDRNKKLASLEYAKNKLVRAYDEIRHAYEWRQVDSVDKLLNDIKNCVYAIEYELERIRE